MLLLFIYLLLTLPFRFVIKRTNNYNRAISLRKFCKVLLYILVVIGVISAAIDLLLKGDSPNSAFLAGKIMAVFFFIPLYYLYAKSLLNVVDFYDEKIIDSLQYFILYLRSFKDDKRRDADEMRCMKMMYNLFCPFAVGVPSEFSPAEGAPRIYIGKKWQEQVSCLFQKAPIILFRISDTTNFLWEVEHCVDNNMLHKSLFWITNEEYYNNFALFLKNKGYELPKIGSQQLNSILYFHDKEVKILPIKTKSQRNRFIDIYRSENAYLLAQYTQYMYGRDKKLNIFTSFNYPTELMPEAQSWSLVAFLFPAFYIIFHPFPYKILSYMAILLSDYILIISTIVMIPFSQKESITLFILSLLLFCLLCIIRLLLSYFMGRNAKAMVWLSEKWSSMEEYHTAQKQANWAACVYGVVLIFLAICIII